MYYLTYSGLKKHVIFYHSDAKRLERHSHPDDSGWEREKMRNHMFL